VCSREKFLVKISHKLRKYCNISLLAWYRLHVESSHNLMWTEMFRVGAVKDNAVEKHVETQIITTGQLALWLACLTAD
jgi:hypothetical protein